MTSREKTCERKENAHCRIFLGGFCTLQNFLGGFVHPAQVIFCNGIILYEPQGQSTSQTGFKVKVGSNVWVLGFFGGFFSGGTAQAAILWFVCFEAALLKHISLSLKAVQAPFIDKFWETRQEETICALCLFKEWKWTHLKGHSSLPVKRWLWRAWNRQVRTKLGTGQFFHVLHSYREETTLLIWNLLSLKLFVNDRMEKAGAGTANNSQFLLKGCLHPPLLQTQI